MTNDLSGPLMMFRSRRRTRWWTAASLTMLCAHSLAARSDEYRVYVTNEFSGDVSIIDGSSLRTIGAVAVGKRPRGASVSPDGRFLYVALSGSPVVPPGVDERTAPPADKGADGIGVIELASGRLTRILRGVSDPEQVVVGADGTRLYVASEDTGTAVVSRSSDGRVEVTIPVGGEPEGVALRPDGAFVYVSSEEESRVAVIDTRTHTTVAHLPVGERPRGIAFSTDGLRAYVTGENDATLTIVDAVAHRVNGTIRLTGSGDRPMGVVASPDGRHVYVATGRSGSVVEIDATSMQEVRRVTVGARPWGIATSPDGSRIFTANGPSNDVSVIDAKSMTVVASVRVGERPWGVAVAVTSRSHPAATSPDATD